MITQNSSGAEPALLEATTDQLVVTYPDVLRVENYAAAGDVDLVLVAPDGNLPFRPNIVFTSTPDSSPLVDASMAAILAAPTQHPGARAVSVDAFYGANASLENPPIGRILTFTYPATDFLDVIVKKWVFATGEHHLHMSASFLPSQARVVEETFDWIAANLRFAESPERMGQAAVGTTAVGTSIDSEASARAGFPLEDLSVIEQAVPSSARAVPVSGVELLMSSWGVQLEQEKVLHLVVRRGDTQGFYAAYVGEQGILVIRSSGTSALDLDSTHVEAYGLSPERLPADAAAWIGVRPAFRFGEARSMSIEEYADSLEGAVDGTPWTELRLEQNGHWIAIVLDPEAGFFEAVAPDTDTIALEVLPAGRLFDIVLRQIDAVLGYSNSETGSAVPQERHQHD